MFGKKSMRKGQTVLEFLFLLLVVIVYLTTVVVPMAKDAQGAVSDTEKVARANNEAQKIANAIQEVSLMGEGSKKTIDVFVPEATTIDCNDASNSISFTTTLTLEPFPAQCPLGVCTKTFAGPTNAPLDCQLALLPQQAKATVSISKATSGGAPSTIFAAGS